MSLTFPLKDGGEAAASAQSPKEAAIYIPNEAAIRAIPQQPQTQCSLTNQMAALRMAAVRLGLYDADDFLRNSMEAGATGLSDARLNESGS